MDLLVFDVKKGHRHQKTVQVAVTRQDLVDLIGEGVLVQAFLVGGLVSVFDSRHIEILHELAGFGQLLEENREERTAVSRSCFLTTFENQIGELYPGFQEDEAKKWSEMYPSMNTLVLSPEETIFLASNWNILEVRKGSTILKSDDIWRKMCYLHSGNGFREFATSYCVYRFLKNNGWVVRNGIMFGCQFLVYSLGPKYYHSSAGVFISSDGTIEPIKLLTLTRILSHNKKSIILASCKVPEDFDGEKFDDVEKLEVEVVTGKTYFLDRDVPQMSLKHNDLYEVTSKLD